MAVFCLSPKVIDQLLEIIQFREQEPLKEVDFGYVMAFKHEGSGSLYGHIKMKLGLKNYELSALEIMED
jgi:hypothetical protein